MQEGLILWVREKNHHFLLLLALQPCGAWARHTRRIRGATAVKHALSAEKAARLDAINAIAQI